MALTKVTKHIVFGSVLIAHYGRDFGDVTVNGATFVQWGTDTSVTPQYTDSHLELVCTGCILASSTGIATGEHYGASQFTVNGSVEYIQRGLIGNNPSRVGGHNHQNQQFGENNGRQNWRHYGYSSALYMNHIHAPSSTNAQVVKTEVACENAGPTFNFSEGYITISEIAGDHYNLT